MRSSHSSVFQLLYHPLLLVVILCSFSPVLVRAAADSDMQLRLAVRRLNALIGAKPNAYKWRLSLKMNILETQAAKGVNADPFWLGEVLSCFQSSQQDLSHPAFDDVKTALQNHIKRLEAAKALDIAAALKKAAGQFRQPTAAEVNALRDRAVYHLEVFNRFCQHALKPELKKPVDEGMQVLEIVEFLKSIKFEQPPEVSAGKLQSQIVQLRETRTQTEREIDATPSDQADKLASLKQKIVELDRQISEIGQARSDVLAKDLPRQRERQRVFNQLTQFRTQFDEIAKLRFDPYFESAHNSFERFYFRYFYASDDNLEEQFLAKLNQLEPELNQLDGSTVRPAAARVGPILGWLEDTGQLPELVTAIRQQFSHPNMRVAIAQSFINRLGSRPVTDTRPVDEMLLGRRNIGSATSTGTVFIETINDDNQAHVSILLSGQLNTNTHSQTGKIKAYTSGIGQFEARRSVFANYGGFFVDEPYAAARMESNLECVTAKAKIIRKIANKVYLRDKDLGESISAGRIERRITRQFRDEVDEVLEESSGKIAEFNQNWVESARLFPDLFVSTSANELKVTGVRERYSTLAAPNGPPELAFAPDMQVRIHESMFSNYADPIFNGKKFTRADMAAEAEETFGEAPEALALEEGDDEWAIWFSRERPIQVEFDSNEMGVTITGRRFSQGSNSVTVDLQIKLRFRIVNDQGVLKLVPKSRTTVELVDQSKSNAKVSAIRTFLERQLNKKSGDEDDTTLPENLIPVDEIEFLRDNDVAKEMTLTQCRMENGWMTLGWNYKVDPALITRDTPAIWPAMPTQEEAQTQTSNPAPGN